MKKPFIVAAVPVLIYIVSVPTSLFALSPFVFSHDLRVGSNNSDVISLQVLLNKDPQTQVATSGAGSPGNETAYFGTLTKLAVIKFQNKYKQEILIPSGLSVGTGFVGAATRAKLTALSAQTTSSNTGSVSFKPISNQNTASVSQNSTQTATVFASDGLQIFSITPYQARPGDNVTVTGRNLTKNTLVTFGNAGSVKVSSVNADGTSAQVTIPSTIGYSDYIVTLSDGTMSSASQKVAIHVVISANPKASPMVTSVSPSLVNALDTTITVTGSGFTQNNSIFTGFGTIKGIASADGTTLTFKPSSFEHLIELQKVMQSRQAGAILYVDFYVVNENGMTQKVSRFNVQ